MRAALPDLGDLRQLIDAESASALLEGAGLRGGASPEWLHLGDRHALVGLRLGMVLDEGPLTAYAWTGPLEQTRAVRSRLVDRTAAGEVIDIEGGRTLVLRFPFDRLLGDLDALLDPEHLAGDRGMAVLRDAAAAPDSSVRVVSWRPEHRVVLRLRSPEPATGESRAHIVRYELDQRRAASTAGADVMLSRAAPGLAPRAVASDGPVVVEEDLDGEAVDLDADAEAVAAALARLHATASELPVHTTGWFVEQAAHRVDLLVRAGLAGRRADSAGILDELLHSTLAGLGASSASGARAPVTSHGCLREQHLRRVGRSVKFVDLAAAARHPAEADVADLLVRMATGAEARLLAAYEQERGALDAAQLEAHVRLAHLGRAAELVCRLAPGWIDEAAAHLDIARSTATPPALDQGGGGRAGLRDRR